MIVKNKKNKKFRILCVDGGGLKGIFTIYALKQLKKEYKINLRDEYDMFIGTSTGALLIAMILSNGDMDEIFELYLKRPNPIFEKKYDFISQIKKTFFAQFENKKLKEIIEKYVGEKNFDEYEKEVKKPFIFTATNISEAKPVIYGSSHFHFLNQRYRNEKVKNALYSSSAAPFYFEPYIEKITNNIIVDGGLWANNPIVAAITYAVGDLGIRYRDIEVLSFGQTSTENLDLNVKKGLTLFKEFTSNDFTMLITSSLIARQNFDNLASTILLKNRLFRYSPEKEFANNNLSKTSDEFINYAFSYWEDNKHNLVKFIKKGRKKNLNYFIGKERFYN